MGERKSYLNIEEKVFKSLGKIGYVVIFILLFSLLMSIIDIILYCFVDNYYTAKFLFTGEMKFSDWWNYMWASYQYSYFKIVFFSLIFLAIGIYRSKALTKEFSK